MGKKDFLRRKNREFIDTAYVNDSTYYDYLYRLKKIATSIFEWVNLPSSMDSRYIELCLYYLGQCSFLYDENYGFINTRCCTSGELNIYGLPTKLNCYSYEYQKVKNVYYGFKNENTTKDTDCILVMNNYDRIPTCSTLELFALRLYEAERTADVNIKSQKTPVMILCDDKTRLTMKQLYSQYDGNMPFIFGDKNSIPFDSVKAIRTEAPFIADKICEYKRNIWNEALMFLGINTLSNEKRERMIKDEANSNNEVINMNLQSYLAPRKEACKKFNEKYGLTGENAIDVRVRSDLYNIIKQTESIVSDYEDELINEELRGVING